MKSEINPQGIPKILWMPSVFVCVAVIAWCTLSASAQPCDDNVFFFSTYGDNTQQFGGWGDFFKNYTAPPGFLSWLIKPVEDTDNPDSPANRWYPFVLDGYEPFDPESISYAFVRFDVYYAETDIFSNDGIAFYDDTLESPSGGYGFATDLSSRLQAIGQNQTQWVSVILDLTSDEVFAYGIDALGVPIMGAYYGRIGSLPAGQAQLILNNAADGDLYGVVQDDMRISYVAFYGKARRPAIYNFPYDYHLVHGSLNFGNHKSLHLSDSQFLKFDSVRVKSLKQRRIEWIGNFNIASNFCEMVLQIQGNLGRRSNNINLHARNINTGQWDGLGTVFFPKAPSNNGFTEIAISNPNVYVDASGEMQIRVSIGRGWLGPGFHMSTDVLRLKMR